MENTMIITRRSRNLGYGWSTVPTGRGEGEIEPPEIMISGGPASLRRGIEERCRNTSGGAFFREALFVGGRRVVRGPGGEFDIPGSVLAALEYQGSCEVML